MIKIIENSLDWSDILALFPNADIYYTPQYFRSFALNGDGVPQLIYFENNGAKAINAVFKRQVPICEYGCFFDYTTVYGYGGWLVSDCFNADNYEKLDSEYCTVCKEKNIISEFVRFHPLIGNAVNFKKMYDVSDLGNTVYMDLTGGQEQIWTSLTGKNRNMIRKAQKLGVKIDKARDKNIFEKFIPIYNSTMDRDNADSYYFFSNEFYDCIRTEVSDNVEVYYAEYDERIIAMAIILNYGKNVHYHLSGSLAEYKNCAATNLLLYTVACDYSRLGFSRFHLGGGVGADNNCGLFKFKESFNKTGLLTFSIGKKIFDRDIYEKLSEFRKSQNNFDMSARFFPLYRA